MTSWLESTARNPLFWPGLIGGSYMGLSAINWVTGRRYPLLRESYDRGIVANRIIAMTHALGSMALSIRAISDWWNLSPDHIINTPAENLMMAFSLGYFLLDTAYLLFWENDPVFLIHHGIAIGFWTSNLWVNKAGYHPVHMLLLGEITNPIQIIWDFSRKYKIKGLFRALSPIYTYFFIFARCFMMPPLTILHFRRIWGLSEIELKWKILWSILAGAINLAGFYWSMLIWKGYRKKIKKD